MNEIFFIPAGTEFYRDIEETVRPYVKALRDSGLNTTASCEHDGYILASSLDATKELAIIEGVMINMDVDEWEARLEIEYCQGYYHSLWHIISDKFKVKE